MSQVGLLCDAQIRALAQEGMIEPFSEAVRTKGIISYGLDSYGYDFRLGGEAWAFSDVGTGGSLPVDPKRFDTKLYFPFRLDDPYAVPPRGFVLGLSVERFKIPRGIMVIGAGKTTYARSGVIVQVTPLNPEWEGVLMLSISNASPHPVLIYPREGIAKLLFFRAEATCESSYVELGGKYQGQEGIVGPRV
ncbi:dCTP deaminase [Candidatus Parcubacteria bacterium]|nr:dCTP deaminase [Candidatus Parcubacteria bacterium]